MLTLKQITTNRDEVVRRLKKKHFTSADEIIDKVILLDAERRSTQQALDSNLSQVNQLSKTIGVLMQTGKKAEADTAKLETARYKEEAKALAVQLEELELAMRDLLLQIPNLPQDGVPEGRSAEDNVIEKQVGDIPIFDGFEPLPHWELAKKYDLIDFELGVKISGAGFPVYKGKGARLQRALINFFLDEAHAAGYLEIMPPTVVNAASGYGTGQLPDKDGQMYHDAQDDLYLIPTAEVPVTNMYRDVILTDKELPIKNCAYTQCFRREAGSYGKDVRGLNRLHEF